MSSKEMFTTMQVEVASPENELLPAANRPSRWKLVPGLAVVLAVVCIGVGAAVGVSASTHDHEPSTQPPSRAPGQ